MVFDKGQSFTWILPVAGSIQGSPEVFWYLLKTSLAQSMSRVSVLFLFVDFNETYRNVITFEKSVILKNVMPVVPLESCMKLFPLKFSQCAVMKLFSPNGHICSKQLKAADAVIRLNNLSWQVSFFEVSPPVRRELTMLFLFAAF